MLTKRIINYIGIILLIHFCSFARGQTMGGDTLLHRKSVIIPHDPDSLDKINRLAPLDMDYDQGLFVLSHDQTMQLRIVGSIRSVAGYDDRVMQDKDRLQFFFIPTGINAIPASQWYASVSQSRFGLEVLRNVKKSNILATRLEMDFKGENNSFRIRHAYARMNNILVGQTWSTFMCLAAFPETVNFGAPFGFVFSRKPMIRFFKSYDGDNHYFIALEFVPPAGNIQTGGNLIVFDLSPDITARIDLGNEKVDMQIAGVINSYAYNNFTVMKVGYGFNAGGNVKFLKGSKVIVNANVGNGISKYTGAYGLNNNDFGVNNFASDIILVTQVSGLIGFQQALGDHYTTNLYYGFNYLPQKSFNIGVDYNQAHNIFANIFYHYASGNRIAFEYNWGRRVNFDGTSGNLNRVKVLFIADF